MDYSKGICIILVVLLNTNYGFEKATDTVTLFSTFNLWAQPFRMPDFFFIAGLFLMRRIDRPWASYLDTKVVHFAYFYILWMSIWYIVRLPQYIAAAGLEGALLLYLKSFIEPLGSLWVIYMLAVFFVAAKLLRNVPVWLAAALLHILSINTGWRVIDEFASRFVYFYSGFVFAPYAFNFANALNKQKTASLFAGLVIWAVLNGWLVFSGLGKVPVVSLVLGFVGTGAVVVSGILLSQTRLGAPIGYLGANTIIVFLSYFIFSVGSRIVILKSGVSLDPALTVSLPTLAGVVGPLLLARLVKNTPFSFLYKRPKRFYLPQNSRQLRGQDIL